MNKPPSQWRGGAGGCPILSQPIADYRRYPFGTYKPCRICNLIWKFRCLWLAIAISIGTAIIAVLIGG